MTKSFQYPENEFNDAAKRQAMRTGEPVEAILNQLLIAARASRDKQTIRKLIQALKFVHNRNEAKRRRKRRK